MDGHGAEGAQVNAQGVEIGYRFAAQEFTADLGMRGGGLLDELNRPAAARKKNGESSAGGSAANDERLRFAARSGSGHGFTRATQRRPGGVAKMRTGNRASPARSMAPRQSSAVKLRRMETGPSCCTKRCQRMSRASSVKRR